MRLLPLLLISCLFAAACTPVLSRESLDRVDPDLTFTELFLDPDAAIGRSLLLGGAIAEVRNSSAGGELEVVQFATDSSGTISDTGTSGGRFLASASGFLDPALYRKGLLITLVGEVRGSKTRRLGEVDYRYPLLAIVESHLWPPDQGPRSPTFHLGIGVGTVIH